MLNYIEYLNVPAKVAAVLVGIFLCVQIIGEILEFKGKVVPEFVKVRKYFERKKTERETLKQLPNTLKNVQDLLNNVEKHYSEDNISKRDEWMKWVNDRAVVYDKSIDDITANLAAATQALQDNTKLTEEMFVQNSRDRIIDFATKASNDSLPLSREEFNRIFKVYHKYEDFLKERGLTNGEINIAHRIIGESYEERMKNHTFVEDIRGY